MDSELKRKLDAIVATGAVLTMFSGCRTVLADAAILPDGQLWFFGVFDERDHFIEFETTAEDDGDLCFLNGNVVARVSELDDIRDQAALADWRQFLRCREGAAVAHAIARMKSSACNWNQESGATER